MKTWIDPALEHFPRGHADKSDLFVVPHLFIFGEGVVFYVLN